MGIEQTEQHPVVNLTWDDAVAFCRLLAEKEGSTYRLPTEAEWEYACRAGSTTRWFFGDDEADLRQYAWCSSIEGHYRKPVGQLAANGFGLYDMYGNVWEMCLDFYSPDYYGDVPRGRSSVLVQSTTLWLVAGRPRTKRGPSALPSGIVTINDHVSLHIGFRPVLLIDPTDPKPTSKPPAEEPKPAKSATQAPPPAIGPLSPEEVKQHQEAWADHLGVPVEREVDLPGEPSQP